MLGDVNECGENVWTRKVSYVRLRSSYVNIRCFDIELNSLSQIIGEFQYDILSEIYFQILIYYVRTRVLGVFEI